MQSGDLRTCCGITLLSEFGNTATAIVRTKFTPKEVEDYLKSQEKTARMLWKSTLMASLNDEQKQVLGHIFKKLGWRVVSKAYHPVHQQHLYVLIKNLKFNEPKKSSRKSELPKNNCCR